MSRQSRHELASLLDQHMAAALDLFTQLKQAHWNVRGPNFRSRHQLFDDLAKRMLERTDALAERIAALGFYVRGTARMVGDTSTLPAYDRDAVDGQEHIRALSRQYAQFSLQLREGLNVIEEFADPATTDLVTRVLVGTEHDLWLMESHLLPTADREHLAPVVNQLDAQEAEVYVRRPEVARVPATN